MSIPGHFSYDAFGDIILDITDGTHISWSSHKMLRRAMCNVTFFTK